MRDPHALGLPAQYDEGLEGGTMPLHSLVEDDLLAPPSVDRPAATAVRTSARSPLGIALLVAAVALAGCAGLAFAAEDAASRALLDRMTQGKVDTDLGRYDAAIAAFAAVADARDATPALRTEALVRLGVARRESGDWEGALHAFERASKEPGLDRDTKALLVRGLGGVLPGDDRWEKIWSEVSFTPDRSDPREPTLEILWPGVPRTTRVREGEPISLDFQDGDLQDIFRLFADISGLNVVVYPGTQGRASLRVNDEPWADVLRRILAPNGYAYALNDNVLVIGRPGELPPLRHFTGKRISIDWFLDPSRPGEQGRDLREALAELAAAGNARVAIAPGVVGRVVLKLNEVRWDQAFDLLARVNGLDWGRDGDTLEVFPHRR
jgi:tetratricopeptide (TPR) repeat protein